VREQGRPDVERVEREPVTPGPGGVGEELVVDLSEEPVGDRVQQGGLGAEVGVQRVGGHPHRSSDRSQRQRGGAALVEQTHGRRDDVALGQ
jgi:hypothetical protein